MERIIFQDIRGNSTGYVDKVGDKLVGSNAANQEFADDWMNSTGKSADEFVQHFQKWGNGYAFSSLVSTDN